MTNEEAQIVIGNIPIKPEVLDDCYDITEYQEAKAMAIKALAQDSITWIVGKDNCQVAVRNMPIDKMQKICAIIGEEEQQFCEDMRDATEEERKSTKDYIDSISKPTGLRFDDIYEEIDFVQPHKKVPCTITMGKPYEDCISRTQALEMLGDEPENWTDTEKEIQEVNDYRWFKSILENLPPVTPQQKTGHWIPMSEGFTPYECSECEAVEFKKSKYCPNCGAKMEVEE